jgi:aminocarboxymuconate-semialdehyde decarboxylase
VTTGVAAIVCGGWLERYPDLKLIAAAGGGGLALLAEKLDMAVAGPGGPPGGSGQPGPSVPPSHSLRRVLVECSCPSSVQLRANLEVFGRENILFGTDAPPLMGEAKRIADLISDPKLGRRVQASIASANAERVFGLDLAEICGT